MTDLEAIKLLLELVHHPQCVWPVNSPHPFVSASIRVSEMVQRVETMAPEEQIVSAMERLGQFVVVSVTREELQKQATGQGISLPPNEVISKWIDETAEWQESMDHCENVASDVMARSKNYVEKI